MTKREHYVPRFYFRNFSGASEQVYVYDIDRSIIYLANTGDVCVRNYLYESQYQHKIHGSSFILPNKHENAFSNLETKYAPLIRGIIRDAHFSLISPKRFELDDERWQKIAQFAAHLFYRNQWIVKRHLDGGNGIEAMKELMEGSKELKLDLEQSKALGIPNEAIAKSVSFEALFDPLSKLFTSSFEQLDIEVIIAPGGSEFVTSSCPLFFDLYDDENDITQIKCAFLPLSPKVSILFYGATLTNFPRYQGRVSKQIVDDLNQMYFMLDAVDKIISGNKDVLESVKRFWEQSPKNAERPQA